MHKVAGGNEFKLGFAIRPKENSLCQPSSKWVLVSSQERIRQRKERDGLNLSFALLKIQLANVPYCRYGYFAMGDFTYIDRDSLQVRDRAL